MKEYIIDIIYVILMTGPFTIIRYYPFLRKLRIKVYQVITIYVSLLSIEIIGFLFIRQNYMLQNQNIENIYLVIWALVYHLVSCIIIDEKISKHTFVQLLIGIIYYGCFIEISNYIYAGIKLTHDIKVSYLIVNIVIKLISILSFPLFIYLTNKIIIPMFDNMDEKIWTYLDIILFILLISSTLTPYKIDYEHVYTIRYLVGRVLVSAGVVSIVVILANTFNKTIENSRLQNKLNSIDKMMSIQQSMYQNLSKSVMQTKEKRHNNRQHLNAINAYISNEDKDGLFDYVSQFVEDVPKEDIIYCKNETINLILGHYMRVLKSNNIKIDLKVLYSEESNYELINIRKTDLWIVLGNILENALEACNRMKESNKFIKIIVKLDDNMLNIVVDNTFDGIVKKDNNSNLYSLKDDNRIGIGISSVKEIVDKYDGVSRFNYDESKFYTSIMLKTKGSTVKA